MPYKIPTNNAVNVNPGKNVPDGNNIAPRKSAIAAIIPALTGPSIIPATAIGKNPKPILRFQACMDTNRVKITSIAINNPIVTNECVSIETYSLNHSLYIFFI